jgi:hypothetical protein
MLLRLALGTCDAHLTSYESEWSSEGSYYHFVLDRDEQRQHPQVKRRANTALEYKANYRSSSLSFVYSIFYSHRG